MATSTVPNVFQDLFDKIEANKVEYEKEKLDRINKLSVRHALAVSKKCHESGYSAHEIYTVITSGHDSQMRDVDVQEMLKSVGSAYADEMIDIWRSKLFMAKMTDSGGISEWRESLAHLLADPDKLLNSKSLKLITSLPRYHEYEERYARLASEYTITDKRIKYKPDTKVELEFIEAWEERSAKEGRRKVYAFKTRAEQLVIVHMTINAYNTSKYLDELLKFTSKFKIAGHPYSRRVGPNQFVPQITRVFDIEAIKE